MRAILISTAILTASCAPDLGSDIPAAHTAASLEAESGYAAELVKRTSQVTFFEKKIDAKRTAWDFQQLAQALTARAGLTGSIADYVQAERALQSAFALGGQGAALNLARATLNMSLHRFSRVPWDLDAVDAGAFVLPADRMATLGIRGDLALQLGNYELAQQHYRSALEFESTHRNRFRLAKLATYTGALEQADTVLAQLIKQLPKQGQIAAFYHVQRGLLDLERGRYAEAEAHYQAANQALSGWWLVREHLAEIYALTGRLPEALAVYEAVVAETQDPELLNALADTLLALKRAEPALVARQAAAKGFDELLARYPEAGYGHALAHELAYGSPVRAVELAEANYRLRPNGAAATSLAEAWLAGEIPSDPEAAAGLMDHVLESTPHRSARVHAVAARAYEAVGRQSEAQTQLQRARAIDPATTW